MSGDNQKKHESVLEKYYSITKREYTSKWAHSGKIVAHNSPSLDQDDWRWRADNGSEASGGATFLANALTSYDFDVTAGNVTARLRFAVSETNNGAASNQVLTLQYNLNGAGFTNVLTAGGSEPVLAVVGSFLVDGNNCTNHGVTGTGTFLTTNAGQSTDGNAGGANLDFAGNDFAIQEFCISFIQANLADNDSITFRLAEVNTATAGNATATITKIAATYSCQAWRWRNDNGSEASGGATFIAAENIATDFDVSSGNVVARLRALVGNTTSGSIGPSNRISRLDYRINSGSWTQVTSGATHIKPYSSSGLTDGANTTDHGVTAVTSTTFKTGTNYGQDEVDGTAHFDGFSNGLNYTSLEYAIAEWAIEFQSSALSDNDVIGFKVNLWDTTSDGAGANGYPTATITKTTTTFLTGTLYSNPDSFGSSKVNPTIVSTRLNDSTDSFGSHTVSIVTNLAGTLFVDSDSFGTHTVSPKIIGTLFNDSVDSFGTSQIDPTIIGTLFNDGDSFGASSISVDQTLTATLFIDGDSFGAHTVSPEIIGTLFNDSVDSFGTSQIDPTIIGTLFNDGDSFGTHTVSPEIIGTLFSDGDSFGSHTVGSVTNLAATLFNDSTDSFGTSQVDPTIIGTLFDNSTDSFGSHSIASGIIIYATLFDDSTDSFGTSQIDPTIVGTLFSDSDSFGVAQINPTIVGTLFSDGDSFGNSSIGISLSATLLDDSTDSFGTHVVTAGLIGTLFVDGDSFGTHTVSPEIIGTSFINNNSFGTSQVDPTIDAWHLININDFPANSIVNVALIASLFNDSTDNFGAATINPNLIATLFDDSIDIFHGGQMFAGEVLGATRLDDSIDSFGTAQIDPTLYHTRHININTFYGIDQDEELIPGILSTNKIFLHGTVTSMSIIEAVTKNNKKRRRMFWHG